jgi:predicted deacetylase
MHCNHEKEGRKCEFGPSRSYDEQFEDIAKGRAILEQAFPNRFFPAFTPPWNRCTTATFKALDELGFQIFSKDRGKEAVNGYRFREISTTIDLYRWKGGATMKEPEEIVSSLIDQIQDARTIGLLLHHKVMDAHAFRFLDHLLQELSRSTIVRFHTFQSLTTSVDGAT